MHSAGDGQEIPSIPGAPCLAVRCQVLRALAGFVETIRFPTSSPAAQKRVDGQEMAVRICEGSIGWDDQPFAGAAEVSMRPPAASTAQRRVEGHETAPIGQVHPFGLAAP
jgi:hypothetical protein